MFTILISFPCIAEGKDAEFRKWFAWSNGVFSRQLGFRRRSLLEQVEGGAYAAIMEFDSQDDFLRTQSGSDHAELAKTVAPLLDGSPEVRFYRTVAV